MKVTPVDIQQIGFRRAFRGYDRQEVDAFLTGLSETFEEMNKENREAKERIGALETSLEELKRKEDLLNRTLVSAERMVDDMKRQDQREAELRVREAEVAADNLTRKAREERTAIEQDVITWRRRQVELVEQFRGFLRGIEKSLDLAVDPARRQEEATAGPPRGPPRARGGGGGGRPRGGSPVMPRCVSWPARDRVLIIDPGVALRKVTRA